MSFTTKFLSLAARWQRSRAAARSREPATVRLFAEWLETRNLLSKTVLGAEHVHFEMNFANGAWQKFDLLDDTHGVLYPKPGKVILYIAPEDLTTQQAGFDFVGAGLGNSFYETPLDTNINVPYTSVAVEAENIPSNTFDFYQPDDPRVRRSGEWMTLSMVNVQGPGYVSMWQDAQIPRNEWWMSSYDGGQTLPSLIYIEPGGHIHVHWGFTQPGTYQVTFQAAAFLGGAQVTSSPVTLNFAVDPGPSAFGGTPRPNADEFTAAFGTALQGLNPVSRAVATGLAPPLASTPSHSAPANLGAGTAPTLDAVHVDGVFATTPARDQMFDLVAVTAAPRPGQGDAGWGDVLPNEGMVVV